MKDAPIGSNDSEHELIDKNPGENNPSKDEDNRFDVTETDASSREDSLEDETESSKEEINTETNGEKKKKKMRKTAKKQNSKTKTIDDLWEDSSSSSTSIVLAAANVAWLGVEIALQIGVHVIDGIFRALFF